MTENKRVPDVIKANLRILFCGINPGLYTAATGWHFAWPGNRFWKSLYLAGYTRQLCQPQDQFRLLDNGLGITNLVARPSRNASEISLQEYQTGGKILSLKLKQYQPAWVAFVGIGAYRKAFSRYNAQVGKQDQTLKGSRVWVLPSTSGLNAAYKLEDIVNSLRDLKKSAFSGI